MLNRDWVMSRKLHRVERIGYFNMEKDEGHITGRIATKKSINP